ncbi:MAG: PKD domain-containing protein, partial [Acidimicrobiia bacterium]|nr:PKD domain-containing protein [Acidimicrobiia bacterium]
MRRAMVVLLLVTALLPVVGVQPSAAGPGGGEGREPVARLTARPASGRAPLDVQFDASGSYDPDGGTITAYRWDFDGNGTVDAQGPDATASHTYTQAGVFSARVTVTDDEGSTARKSVQIRVRNTPPAASFSVTFDKVSMQAPLRADFDASASVDTDGSVVSYRWDFDGDGTVDDTSGAVTSHVYDTAGIYLARLVVADNLGATAARAQMITVAANEAPTASFATSPTEGLAAPIEIAFDASASSDPEDGTALTYAWDFEGDGTVDTLDGPATTHVYTAAGVYLPTLTVTDTEGASDTTTQLLLLAGNQAPTVALDTDTSEGVAPASIFFEGTAADADGDTVTLELTPGDGSPTLTPAASVSHTYTTPGVHTAVLTARDPAGAATSVSVQISVAAPPVLVPPAPKAGVVTLVADVAQSLYSGDTPVQTGVEAESLEPAEVAIARGRVLDQAGNPLAGARVSVRDRDDLGVTHSRADGWWDMAVDSGGRLVFDIAKPGYVPNQRTLEPRAGRWEVADETALVPYDTAVTEIDFDAPIEVARGSTVTDDRGTRQQTVLFQQGTEGTVRHTDGTAETLDAMSVRATEITVGPLGKAAMPKLPETVLYNYAVEFYVDEARLAGDDTASIRLSKPAFSYTENFRGFVDGTPVPCGFYNRGTGFWDVCDSGVTVTVLDGTTDSDEDGIGEALLNTDSDADADAGVDIDADGTEDAEIGADEREALAALYSPGTSLWRVRLDHFSTYDFNPGWIMGAAVQPGGDVDGGNDGLDDSCETGGSVIECENQTLGETVAVAGTENTLNYRSSRVPGRVDDYKLEISLLTDGTVPAGVAYACVVVRVAGVEYARRLTPQDADGDGDDDGFTDPDSGCLWDVTGWMEADLSPPSPSLEVTDPGHARFTWDGLDAYGTAVNGVQEAEVKIIYLYPVDCSASSSFGMVSSDGPIYLVGGGCPDYVGISTIVEEEIGHYSNPVDELGGWSLDEHHVYDPATGILNYGTGRFRRLDPGATGSAANYQISTLAEVPTDDDDPYSPWVEGIAVGPDGDIYMADMTGSEGGIWRMNSHGGNVERVAEEMGDLGIWGHGPRDIAYADGNLYIANGELGLRRLDLADHTMVTLNSEEGWGWDPSDYFAGWRAQYLEIHPTSVAVHGDSVFATSEGGDLYRIMLDGEDNEDVADVERIYSGDGTGSYALAVDGGGDVYVGVKNSVLRIDPYGNMSVVAGFWGWCPPGTEPGDGDGGPATEACLGHVSGLAVSDSTLFVADGEDQRIRAVSLETGMISTVAGTGEAGYSGDGGPAVLAEMHSSYNYDNVGGSGVAQHWGIEATDDGLVIADSNNQVIRELTPIFPGVDGDDILVPSEDGSLLFQFDEYGRHEFTLNALTLQTLLNFDYDADGLLTGVTDAFGRRLDIDRPDTQTVTLTSPDGGGHQVTTITRDAAGYADTFGYPGGYTVDVTHGQGATGEGLLGDLTDPAGNYHQYKYDGLGRLVYDYGPDGGYKALVRTPLEPEGGDLDVDYAITLTSLRDTTTSDTATETYTVTRDETGTTRTYTDPTGATTTTVKDPTGTITAGIQADGTTTRTESTGDPRWGMLAPYPMSVDVDVPGRGRQSVDTARSYSYVIESGVVASATQDVTFTDADGAARTVTSEYDWDPDTAEGTVVAGTPEGRTDTMTLDRYGRPVGYDPAPIDGVDQESVAVVYDALGRVDTVSEGSRVTDYDYYTSGESPGDRWEGALKSVTDPTGRTGTVVGYDALLRPLDARNHDGTTSGVRYDDNGNITRVLMPSSGDDHDTHVYDYDSADRPTGHEPPDIQGPDGSTGATWNLDGTPDSAYDADGRSATSTYTPGTGRLDCVDYDSDAAETADVDESRDCTTVPEGAAH